MSDFWDFFQHLFNPRWIFLYFGNTALFILLAIVFAETGFFIGFFLPGDSLLFTAGIFGEDLCRNFYDVPFFVIILIVAGVATLGNIQGYWLGYKSGQLLYKKKDSFFFKKKHLILAKLFYNKYKTTALIMSRFLPMFRSFAPIVAGAIRIDFKKFMIYNVIGALAWTFSIMLAGHYLDKSFPELKNHLEWIILLIVFTTTLPIIVKLRIKKKALI
ncbi:VTT domain-containing protein [Blattabacterium sp. (Blattella germanica)]|uniref:DedA family protein n=1 Tax=Blattabacterium sp. (Blattella germanica) TaxID=624186 RepID=UPI0005A4FC61|nr:VTT domain-containing protein [Blattabacterium sp. (Blattella germanica)]